ncbi:MAG: ATP synthase F1 subunit epsilon [Lachnospiraceae bacterium]|nr:ATP synthase F1 subunit epsilon [Lachnospiraceae bacterium]
MSRTFHLRIYAADRTFYEGEAEYVSIPTVDGEYGVMAYHENLVVSIVAGTLKYRFPAEEMQIAFVSPGMMRVENNDVLILVETVERPEEIDENRSQERAREAREAMALKRSRQEYLLAEATLQRAVNRLKVKKRNL